MPSEKIASLSSRLKRSGMPPKPDSNLSVVFRREYPHIKGEYAAFVKNPENATRVAAMITTMELSQATHDRDFPLWKAENPELAEEYKQDIESKRALRNEKPKQVQEETKGAKKRSKTEREPKRKRVAFDKLVNTQEGADVDELRNMVDGYRTIKHYDTQQYEDLMKRARVLREDLAALEVRQLASAKMEDVIEAHLDVIATDMNLRHHARQ